MECWSVIRKSCLILLVAMLLPSLVVPAFAKQSNVSVLYGYNGSGYYPVQATAAGELKTNLLLNETPGIIPLTNNTYDIGSASAAWNRLYARSLRGGGPLSFFAGGSERLTILANGNIGIGNSAPQQTLEVVGTLNATGRIFSNGSLTIRGINYVFPSADGTLNQVLTTNGAGVLSWNALSTTNLSGGGAANYVVKWQNTTHFTNSVITDDGTNVGIGASSPTEKLGVQGNINISGTLNASKLIGEGTAPAGMLMFFNATACPAGWVNFTDVRGRTVVGLLAGGTLRGTSGTVLSDLGTKTITDVPAHTHSVDPPGTVSSSSGSHDHAVDPPATTSGTSSHTHSADPGSVTTNNPGNHAHALPEDGAGTGGGGKTRWSNQPGLYFITSSSSGSHSHSYDIASTVSSSEASHTHATDIASFTSGSGGGHTHSTDVASFTTGSTGSASVDVTMPYIQLMPCIKT